MSNTAGDPPASAPLRGTVSSRMTMILAIVLLVVLAAVVGSHWPAFTGNAVQAPAQTISLAERPATPAQSDASADVKRELASLTQRLETAESRLGGSSFGPQNGAATTFGDLATRLGALDARVSLLENRLARAADRDVQTALQQRVARLETESSGAALKRAASVLALATLARAAGEPRSFKTQLDAMAALSPEDPAVEALAPYAAQGVPTLALLRERFPPAARAALDTDRAATAGNGMFSRLWAGLAGLIRVRRVDDAAGRSNDALLARAQRDLDRSDLRAAAEEVRGLSGPAVTAMAPWLNDADARLSVERTLEDMDVRMVQALAEPLPVAAPPPPSAPPPQAEAAPAPPPAAAAPVPGPRVGRRR